MYAIIMAGGSGTRLWPKSRKNSPKQLHALLGENTLIQETIKRITPLIPYKDIFINTNKEYVHKIKSQVPGVPHANITPEFNPLGTAVAIALGMMKVAKIDPNATAVVLWADNTIEKEDLFLDCLQAAEKAIDKVDGVIIGIKPTFPCTGYGYIEVGRKLDQSGDVEVHKLNRFIEKPNLKKAEKLINKSNYLWNSGISVWKVSKYLEYFKEFMTEQAEKLERVAEKIDGPEEEKAIEEELRDISPIAVEYAITERVENLAVIPADLGWSDIGSWAVLKDILPNDQDSNAVKGKCICSDTQNCLIHGGERLITTLGIKDLIIVDTDDVVLVAHKDKSQEVKELLEKIKQEGKHEYL